MKAFGADVVELHALNVTLTYPIQRQVRIVEGKPYVCP